MSLLLSLKHKETIKITVDTDKIIEINLYHGSKNNSKIVINADKDIKITRVKKEEEDEQN